MKPWKYFLLLLAVWACKAPKPVVSHYENLTVNKNASDTAWFNWVKPYSDSLKKTMNSVIGKTDTSWNISRPNSNLGNLITDCLIDYGNHYLADSLRFAMPEIALMNAGGIRTSLPKGDITLNNIFEILPFENELVLVKVRGSLLDSLVQYTAQRGGEPFAGVFYNLRKLNEKTNEANNIKINNIPLKNEAFYWLITNDYLANGGDGFSMFKYASQKIFTKITIRDAAIKVISVESKFGGKLTKRTERRIYVEN